MALSDEERLIELVRKRLSHLGLHSHLFVNEYVARELVRSLRDGDGVTLIPPPAPEPTYTIRVSEVDRKDLLEVLGPQTKCWGVYRDLMDATPDEDTDGAE